MRLLEWEISVYDSEVSQYTIDKARSSNDVLNHLLLIAGTGDLDLEPRDVIASAKRIDHSPEIKVQNEGMGVSHFIIKGGLQHHSASAS